MKKNTWRYHYFITVCQQSSWYDLPFLGYSVWNTEISNYGSFFALYPQTAGKIKIFEKWYKHLEMSSFYTCVPNITIIWCMLPEIWNTTDIIFCHFGQYFALPHYQLPKWKFGINVKKPWDIMLLHMCTINKVHVMYGSWDIRQDKQLFWAIFCPLTLTTRKIKILKKSKKCP